ncbi:MAG: PP2C family protein-serine/threonine phosphatase [Fibrobacteria bacterium]|nr:PP2C family protein-serine/threonine phosphatase [Fibrobacteria bacterium]
MQDLENRQNRQLRSRLESIATAGEILRVSLGTTSLRDAVRTLLLGLAEVAPCRAAAIFEVEGTHLRELGRIVDGEIEESPSETLPLDQVPALREALVGNRHAMVEDAPSLVSGRPSEAALFIPFEGRLGTTSGGEEIRASHLLWVDAPEGAILAESLDTLVAMASQAGVVLTGYRYRDDLERTYKALQTANNRLQRDIDRARRIQEGLLPQNLPDIPGLSVASRYQPAEKVSGDYFDCFPLDPTQPQGVHCLVMADVSGHGISAAMVMAMFKVLLRRESRIGLAPSVVLERMNRTFLEQVRGLHYVTVFLAHFDPTTGLLVWCSAGHCPQILVRADGAMDVLAGDGLFVGAFDDLGALDRTTTMRTGDTLVLYTDGITEAEGRDGELFEFERLSAILGESSGQSASGMLQSALDRLAAFVDGVPLQDDLTLFAARA